MASQAEDNDVSFNPEANLRDDETSEGESHSKSIHKKRSSSQITIKKPMGMNSSRRYLVLFKISIHIVLLTLKSLQ